MCVTAIIPAYNEEKLIEKVLIPLKKVPEITQIIVVSDGSTDNTVQVALTQGVFVIELKDNCGKGGAIITGLRQAENDYVLFLDADLVGLTEEHVQKLIRPVLDDQVDMTVGVFENGRLATDMAQVISPFLSGQRCIKKDRLRQIPGLDGAGFGVEAILTNYANQHRWKVVYVQLPNMSHVMKEEKLGLLKGLARRMKMYWEIAKSARY